MSRTIVEFLTARLDEAEVIAREASRRDEHPVVEGGEHWQWVCREHDEVVTPDPLTQEILECPQGNWDVDLRSAEEYPTTSVGLLPHFVLRYAEETSPVVAQHISRHDPAHVLADITAKRRIVEWCGEREKIWIGTVADNPDRPKLEDFIDGGPAHPEGHIILRLLASAHTAHPDYDPDWAV